MPQTEKSYRQLADELAQAQQRLEAAQPTETRHNVSGLFASDSSKSVN